MNIKRIGKAIMVLLLATPALSSMELMAQNLKMPTLEDLLPGGATYRIILLILFRLLPDIQVKMPVPAYVSFLPAESHEVQDHCFLLLR